MQNNLMLNGQFTGSVEGSMKHEINFTERINGDSDLEIKVKDESGETLKIIINARKLAKEITPFIEEDLINRTRYRMRARGGSF